MHKTTRYIMMKLSVTPETLAASQAATETPTKILSFGELASGWHYGEGGPIQSVVIDAALDLYWRLYLNDLTHTDAFPGAHGEIQLTAYHTTEDQRHHYISIMIEPTLEFSLVHEVDGEEVREPVETTDIELLKSIISDIAGEIVGQRWSTSDIFTPRTSTTPEDALRRSHSKNPVWTNVPPLLAEIVWTPSGTGTVTMQDNSILRR